MAHNISTADALAIGRLKVAVDQHSPEVMFQLAKDADASLGTDNQIKLPGPIKNSNENHTQKHIKDVTGYGRKPNKSPLHRCR